jgi:hypothetical protein
MAQDCMLLLFFCTFGELKFSSIPFLTCTFLEGKVVASVIEKSRAGENDRFIWVVFSPYF